MLVLVLALLLAVVGATVTSLGGIAVARQRAASAADLSALAVAGGALDGEAVACRKAVQVAERAGARLSRCRLEGDVAVVVAEVRPAGPLARLGTASARARAGPATGGAPAGRP